MNLCPFKKWKDIFGEINKGVHKYKIGGSPIVDYMMTIVCAMIITYFYKIPLTITTIILLILGIIFHVLFGVETDTVKFLKLAC